MSRGSASSQPQRTRSAQALLLLTNPALFVAGILIIIYATRVGNSTWLFAFEEQFTWFQPFIYNFMIALGCLAIILASFGYAFLKKGFMCCCNILGVLATILSVVVLAGVLLMLAIAKYGASTDYPAATQEPGVNQTRATITWRRRREGGEGWIRGGGGALGISGRLPAYRPCISLRGERNVT